MRDNDITKTIIFVIVILAVLTLLVISLFPNLIQALKDSGKTSIDKCKPAPGYTEESWREHISHHPNIYKECLI